MQTSASKIKNTELLNQLKRLPEEDRIILGLYLYEGLTSDEIASLLTHSVPEKPHRKATGKMIFKKHFSSL